MNIKKKDFMWSMFAHLLMFIFIWLIMGISHTWNWFGKESILFFLLGFPVSIIINLLNPYNQK